MAKPKGHFSNKVKTHCNRGHEFTPENTSLLRKLDKKGRAYISRKCRACAKLYKTAEYKLHPEAAQKRALQWYADNTPHVLARVRTYELMRKFGITKEQYEAMQTGQNNCCAICGEPESKTRRDGTPQFLAVDHDHVTDRLRELLCRRCNVILGMVAEKVDLLLGMARYLEKHREVAELEALVTQ